MSVTHEEAMQDKNVFYTDQAEWYVICNWCYSTNADHQWSGSTRVPNFSEYLKNTITPAVEEATHCEWCKKELGGRNNVQSGALQYGV